MVAYCLRMHAMANFGRRALVTGLAATPLLRPARAADQPTRRRTLILGLDIGDTVTFDPARQIDYTPPLTLVACYDTLVTLTPGHYQAVAPSLAEYWERTPDARGWRFTLRADAVFATGNRVTPDDVAFSLARLLAIGNPPARYLDAIADIQPSGPDSVDVVLKDPDRPLLPYLASPPFAILEKAVLDSQNGSESAWLSQNSAGSGDYVLRAWQKRDHILLDANPHAWRGAPAYDRILIRHIPDSTAQMRALQRGDIDVAFNLLPTQLDQLQTDGTLRIETSRSLDLVYLALTADPSHNQALAQRPARQAIAAAIDYDDLIGRMLGAKATRPASFLPIGLLGSTAGTASGFRQDLDGARALLAQAGRPDGFTFDLAYADAAIAGLPYDTIARKLRTDLARVGIAVTPVAMNPYAFRDAYFAGKLQAALAFWTSPVVANGFWARVATERLGGRVAMAVNPALADLIARAETETDAEAQRGLWLDYQKAMVSIAQEIVLFQPEYQVAISRAVATFPLTAAGWMADLAAAQPATRP